ncbi:protein abrupt-like isoform X3 [Anopheles funestus]|uniref:BTB domain-containing protein n=1 Tax=Anopheles funestus TaxID=62324 RepID=A0A4Y0BKQ8_ANOFN|nr:protein abrupt-like isoform X3 [Anopheles funestus]
MNPQQFSLRWNNYTSYIAGAFDSLRYEEDFVDVTLCCEGRKIRAHKILLSACSPYFKDVFKENPCQHPVIIFKNVRYTDLMSLVEFMYQGEVSVPQEQLPSFLHTAEILAIRGLTDNTTDSRQQTNTTTSAIAQQLIQSQAVLDKSATITTTDSLYLTLPSNSTIVHQPKLVQAQIQTTPIITKPLIKPSPPEMPALTASTTTMAVPITQQQQQPTIAKIQVQASTHQQQQQQVQVQVQQVAVQQVQQTQQSQQNQQQTTSQVQSQPQHQTTQATTLQEVVDNVVQPRKKKIKGQQIITSQPNSSVPSASTVTVTTTSSGQSGENEMYETDTYTITTKDAREEQEHEQYTENGQSGATLKMEIPEFISVGEPINSGNGTNNTFLQESYELVSENIEEKDDDEDMAQDNIEIEGSEMDMSRIFQGSTDEQTKSNILQDIDSDNKWARCKVCRLLITASNLWRHVRTQHSRLEPKRCDHCNKQFKNKYSLREHVRITHESKQLRDEMNRDSLPISFPGTD